MNFNVRRPKTRTLKGRQPRQEEPPKADITPISIDAMELATKKGKCYFKRLKYKGCPQTASAGNHKGNFSPNTVLIDMHRDDFIHQVYGIWMKAKEDDSHSLATLQNVFDSLTKYVSDLDEAGRPADFSAGNIKWYMDLLFAKKNKGELKKSIIANHKHFLSFVLKALGRSKEAQDLPPIKGVKKAAQNTKPMGDNDHTDSYLILNDAYKVYARHLVEGTTPECCPLFDERRVRSMKKADGSPRYLDKEINQFRGTAKKRINGYGDWRNLMVKVAFLLVARHSGGNLTPLSNLKRKHVRLKKLEGDKYVFDLATIKGRAQYEEQLIPMGFSKSQKEFLESWLNVSARFASSEDDYVFPSFSREGKLKHIGNKPQYEVNKALSPYELPAIHCRVLRKTRSSKYIRATGNVHKAAVVNRNALGTTISEYADGNQQTNDIELAGALVVQGNVVSGQDKREAINEAKAKFRDPLSDYDYQKRKGKSANKTTTGVRCGDPHGDKAKKSMRKMARINRELKNGSEPDTCIDFLACFDCPHHVLISEVDDIWQMMSFRDSIISAISRPSFNSMPSEKLEKLLTKTDAALELLKEKASENYAQARERNDYEPHPLYDDEHALEDLIRMYS
ncbi:hypothetical protein C942_02211 [Photobacterium marinum]|uniref:Uncharacterized protein n=1 Tax=Photobacterium marinum TaxID=1056511 RepID=L8J715_9GAMM|nr:hypothetical protein [Photobacterium marinum]ELR64640.1 hypothetical protein C942_02211 [Photobacterium marinum]